MLILNCVRRGRNLITQRDHVERLVGGTKRLKTRPNKLVRVGREIFRAQQLSNRLKEFIASKKRPKDTQFRLRHRQTSFDVRGCGSAAIRGASDGSTVYFGADRNLAMSGMY